MSDLAVLAWIGVVIVVVLAVIAGRLLWLLHRQRQAEQARAEAESEVGQKVAVEALDSVQILARCYLAGQVGGSEAALRIAVLLDQPAMSTTHREQGRVFTEVAAKLSHIPTHADWKALSRAEREQFRQEMEALESRFAESMKAAAEQLVA
ncbi:DUF2489 domain-containing protein [Spongiibacter nanhainus]|uniref:DUF2489 domain-containing protein n=1 Tax=Spongiibacter nanhainus TaxID=2794344 RepID=A0A7T4USE4_9GAMM|nr:DUF2489 domain-containing protein [Spongiibacter nanhainus]QQD19370.1 DUF2489 domain-containing protein [Spongiibacter nanhainus]